VLEIFFSFFLEKRKPSKNISVPSLVIFAKQLLFNEGSKVVIITCDILSKEPRIIFLEKVENNFQFYFFLEKKLYLCTRLAKSKFNYIHFSLLDIRLFKS